MHIAPVLIIAWARGSEGFGLLLPRKHPLGILGLSALVFKLCLYLDLILDDLRDGDRRNLESDGP